MNTENTIMGLMRHEHLYKNFTHTNFSANPFKNKDYRSERNFLQNKSLREVHFLNRKHYVWRWNTIVQSYSWYFMRNNSDSGPLSHVKRRVFEANQWEPWQVLYII